MAGPGGRDLQGRQLSANSMSVVVRISYQSVPQVLLAGDLDAVGLDNLLEHYPSPRAAVLVFPHHGGRPANADPTQYAIRLSQAVQPEVVVFSIGRGRYQTPRPEIVAGILRILPTAHIACTQLSTYCAVGLPSVSPIHLAPVVARGRASNACCAGSILLTLNPRAAQPLPGLRDHHAFVIANAPSALCRRS